LEAKDWASVASTATTFTTPFSNDAALSYSGTRLLQWPHLKKYYKINDTKYKTGIEIPWRKKLHNNDSGKLKDFITEGLVSSNHYITFCAV